MKKIQIKLDKASLQRFAIAHVEKIAFAVIILLIGVVFYLTFSGVERYHRTPSELAGNTERAEGMIKGTQPDTLEITDYATLAEQSRMKIKEDAYTYKAVLDPPVFAKRSLRAKPDLFAVEKLRGTGAIVAFNVAEVPEAAAKAAEESDHPTRTKPAEKAKEKEKAKDRGGKRADLMDPMAPVPSMAPTGAPGPAMGRGGAVGGHVRGQAMVSVVGLVPDARQQDAYQKAFRNSIGYNPAQDTPNYLGFWIKRIEVTNTSDLAHLDWDSVKPVASRVAIKGADEKWAATRPPEVVDARYLGPNTTPLVFPLGPLVGRTWGADVAHEPEIPILAADKRTAVPTGFPGGGMMSGRRRDMMRPDAPAMAPVPPGGGVGGGRAVGQPGDRKDSVNPDDPFGEKSEEVVDVEKETEEARLAAEEENKVIKYKLFRFLDLDVEPGRSYVYRVQLILSNPNRDLKPGLLKSSELAKEKYLATDWSEPSEIVTIPRDTRVLVKSVKPAPKPTDASANIVVTKWMLDKGIEVYQDIPQIFRGQVANYPNHPCKVSRLTPDRAEDDSDSLKADFLTETTIVDMRGGAPFDKKDKSGLTEPAEILFLDSAGRLSVRNELTDSLVCDDLSGTRETEERVENPVNPLDQPVEMRRGRQRP